MFNVNEIIQKKIAEFRKGFKGSDEEFDRVIKEKSKDIAADFSQFFLHELLKYYNKTRIKEVQENLNRFLKWHSEPHKDSFELFLMFMDLQVSINADMNNHFDVDKFPEDEKLKFNQLLHLHIKACKVADEIYTLIVAGYSDAALARWRTLHETCVVFNALYYRDAKVSIMFYEFQFIEKLKRARTYQIHHGSLNWRAIDDATMQLLEDKKAELIQQYGPAFGKDYGWTLDILAEGKRNFAGLEELTGLSYLRPFYQWANQSVHAGPEGLFSRLAYMKDDVRQMPREILAGPSRYGMVDPMQFTTNSMLNMTSDLLAMVDTFENSLLRTMLEFLNDEIKNLMIEASKKLP